MFKGYERFENVFMIDTIHSTDVVKNCMHKIYIEHNNVLMQMIEYNTNIGNKISLMIRNWDDH